MSWSSYKLVSTNVHTEYFNLKSIYFTAHDAMSEACNWRREYAWVGGDHSNNFCTRQALEIVWGQNKAIVWYTVKHSPLQFDEKCSQL